MFRSPEECTTHHKAYIVKTHGDAYRLAQIFDAGMFPDETVTINCTTLTLKVEDGTRRLYIGGHIPCDADLHAGAVTPSELASGYFWPCRKYVNDWMRVPRFGEKVYDLDRRSYFANR